MGTVGGAVAWIGAGGGAVLGDADAAGDAGVGDRRRRDGAESNADSVWAVAGRAGRLGAVVEREWSGVAGVGRRSVAAGVRQTGAGSWSAWLELLWPNRGDRSEEHTSELQSRLHI